MAFHLIRVPVAALLLVAAHLKMQELLTPFAEQRVLMTLLVEAEWLLAVWLLSGVYAIRAWAVSLGCFVLFAGYSLIRVIQGAESCGCFGYVQVDPRITLALDMVLIALLLLFRPQREIVDRAQDSRVMLAAAVGLALAVGLPAGYAMLSYQPGRLLDDGAVAGDPHYVKLDPEAWSGRPLPILRHIEEIEADLRQGRWSLMFYSHECPTCLVALDELLAEARDYPDRELLAEIALVNIAPPDATFSDEPLRPLFKTARLSDRHRWVMPVPTVVHLREGTVTSATPNAQIALPEVKESSPATQPAP